MQYKKKKLQWYQQWFNSPYYHILYKNRDKKEAQELLDHLLGFLNIRVGQKKQILDLACGKGRHAIYINHKYKICVDGVDISSENIQMAQKHQTDTLHFYCQDMQLFLREGKYDMILSMFTSFGYFKKDEDNFKVIENVYKNLKKGGVFVLDFFNTHLVVRDLPKKEVIKVADMDFNIHKYVKDGFITKEIRILEEDKPLIFHEYVKEIYKEDFLIFFEKLNLELLYILGNYQLDSFDESTSNRMIFIVRK